MKQFTLPVSAAEPDRLWQFAGLSSADGVMLMEQIDDGLDGTVASRIVTWAQISQAELRRMTGIAGSTFTRGVKSRFTAEQSERLVRFIRVMDRAVELFEGDKEKARQWLNEPARALGNKKPADLVASETGAYEVLKLITRLEHGVYS
ncbi:type II RES/Xre toxin-antitoxin system antitoxin [Pantoea ananatis]|uniref:type II RES/Xre toxin-antitoxin system antitoxin n=1 Tax=Pantoea ananas TaxID=553 RepID=UPI001B317E5F|nr:antitoxin Xre/MbcA/ParS toxin-binding domain-containing protein [Pantoea ananatis]